ncbi:MAG: site-specific DNA-methyltransferase [Bacteroidales bacterium]|nr:site-specific DNA-methyltransferase [Bacteroidales bacterium]
MTQNLLIYGENLDALNYLLNERGLRGKVDLVYIDPPYATGTDFVVSEGRASTISSARDGIIAYSDKLKGQDFLDFLEKRLVLLKELLSEKGSIYLHIDYKIGHYVKVLMDKVFGIDNFRSDISRIKCNPKNFKRIGYGNIKDMILFYTKGDKPIWNEPKEKYSDADIEKLFPKTDNHGRRYTTVPIHAPGETLNPQPFKGMLPPKGRHWRTDVKTLEEWDAQGLIEWSANGNPRKKIFADEQEGKRMQDIWEFKDPQYPDYPTEKNLDMLKTIVKTSSNTDSIVLDCFCGSGTTLLAAQLLDRKWIGIDQSETAIATTEKRLNTIVSGLFATNESYKKISIYETSKNYMAV